MLCLTLLPKILGLNMARRISLGKVTVYDAKALLQILANVGGGGKAREAVDRIFDRIQRQFPVDYNNMAEALRATIPVKGTIYIEEK